MNITKFVVIQKNIFGRLTRNVYHPKTNEDYLNFVQNLIDSKDTCFFVESIDDARCMEEVSRGFSDKEFFGFMIYGGIK